MTNTELVLNMLAEVAATDISIVRQPSGYNESAAVAKEGAKTAKAAREQLEKSTGKTAISKLNAKELKPLITDAIEPASLAERKKIDKRLKEYEKDPSCFVPYKKG